MNRPPPPPPRLPGPRAHPLRRRQRTGQGQLVEVSMQEVIANVLRDRHVDHYRDGRPSERRGNALVGGVPGGAYLCAGGGLNDYVFICSQPINVLDPLEVELGRSTDRNGTGQRDG